MTDHRLNPYSPGAGTDPPLLVGRDIQLQIVMETAAQVEAGRRPEHLVFTGLRGVGKTVMLRECLRRLRDREWLCGYCEVRRDAESGLAIGTIVAEGSRLMPGKRRMRAALRTLRSTIGGVTITGGVDGTVSLQVDTSRSAGSPDPYLSALELFRTLARAARHDGVGVALCLDELQSFLRRDATTLLQALQADETEDSRVLLLGAGLPVTPIELTKARTYAERFRYEPLDDLHQGEARRALAEPAGALGVTWSGEALGRVIELAQGYPWFLQLYASEAWQSAHGRDEITLADVQDAEPRVQRRLDSSIYSTRYARVSPREREYLIAMAELLQDRPRQHSHLGFATNISEGVRSGAVAGRLGRVLSDLSVTRDRLIRKGVIHSPQSGMVAFSVPGFTEYVLTRARREQV